MTFSTFFDWLRKGDYTRSLEAEVTRLRAENRSLLNTMLRNARLHPIDGPMDVPIEAFKAKPHAPRPVTPPSLSAVMRMPIQAEPVVAQQKPQRRGIGGINQSLREREAQSAKEARERAERLQGQIESYEKIAVEKAKGVSA